MSTNDDESKGICILSFDNGGPGTYSQLLILKEYMSRLENDLGVDEEDVYPVDHFDLMGGVGFGGLIAIMLGHLRMNVDEAVDALITVATAVFSECLEGISDPDTNSKKLKDAVEEMLQTRTVPVNTKMYERDRPQTRCKVILYAATSANINYAQPFRTYSTRGSDLNPTIVEAICATISIPLHFSPVKIGPRSRQQSFIGGAFGTHNPTRELLNEASAIFGKDRRVSQILSLGSGLPRVLSVQSSEDGTSDHRLLADLMADCETVARDLGARLYNVDAYLRLNVDRGMEAIKMMDWAQLGNIESHTNVYIGAAVVTHALDASMRSVKERVGVATLGQINQSNGTKIEAKRAPSVSPYFVLRVKEWERLVWHLVTSPSSRQRILPITGMGGCGKTQLVSYFLQEYPSLFKHVAYVDASTLSSIKADLQVWAKALGNGHERDTWEDAARILASGPEDERLGLILDNADDPTLNLVPFIPKSVNLTVIITSRNRNLGNLSTTYHMELREMEPDEALATLLHAARRQLPLSTEESESAHTLLKELGCLAVALVQAGTYCHELSISFTRYLKLFYTHRAELMQRAEPSALDSYQRGAYTTLDLSYTALPQTAREFLHFVSYFHHTDIPLAALAAAAEYKFDDDKWSLIPRPDDHASVTVDLERLLCVDGIWSEMQVQDTLRILRSFSLLSITSVGETVLLQLHPLIQAWSRDMDLPASRHYRLMASRIITSCSRDAEFQLYRLLTPHILDILAQLKGEELHVHDLMAAGKVLLKQGHYHAAEGVFQTTLDIVAKFGNPSTNGTVSGWLADVYRDQGRWIEAEKLEVEVLEQQRGALGEEHPETIRAAANLALTYHAQSRWSEAEKLEVEVLEKRRRVLGSDHRETIWSIGNLAGIYSARGQWSEAEKLSVEVLEKRRKVLGMEHPDTIEAAASLASTYQAQCRWDEAERLEVTVLEQRKRILGNEHPDTIRAAGNLASTYNGQSRWNEAERLEVNVLEQRKRILGNEHPDTTQAATTLASIYNGQGRWSEAEKLDVEMLEQQKRILGDEHPSTILAAANLAAIYRAQDRWDEAKKLEANVLEQRKRTLGDEHPDTIEAAANLAATYYAQGRWVDAEKQEVEVLEQRKRILGNEHPDTINAAASLATTYREQGRWSEAEKLEVNVLEQRKRILGNEHSYTILAAANLAATYREQGRWSEAEKLEANVLEQRQRILGDEHSYTILAAANLAGTYRVQGRWDEAEKLEVNVLEQRKRILGDEHSYTILAAANLAATYREQGRWSEAEDLEVNVLEQRKKILGDEHPYTILAAANLAAMYYAQGRWDEAGKAGVEVLEQRKRILGNEHPDTILAASSLASTYSAQGQLDEAEKLEASVLEQRKKILGDEHPDTILAAANLAATYRAQGRSNEAEELGANVLERRKRILGDEHPDTIVAVANLAATYRAQGRWNEAEKLEVGVLEQGERILGNEHPNTILAALSLAATYYAQGRWDKAEKLEVRVLEQRKRILGNEHLDTILAASSLASTYYAQGRWDEAEKVGVEVLEQRKRILGNEHPDTILAAVNLTTACAQQGRWEEAAALLASTVQISLKVLGQQHPRTQEYLSILLQMYDELGMEKEAHDTRDLLIPPITESQGVASSSKGISKTFRSFFRFPLRKKFKRTQSSQ